MLGVESRFAWVLEASAWMIAPKEMFARLILATATVGLVTAPIAPTGLIEPVGVCSALNTSAIEVDSAVLMNGSELPRASTAARSMPMVSLSASEISTMAASMSTWVRRTSSFFTMSRISAIWLGSPRTTIAFRDSSAWMFDCARGVLVGPLVPLVPALPPAEVWVMPPRLPPPPPLFAVRLFRISAMSFASAWAR